jgi:hypothetical protein
VFESSDGASMTPNLVDITHDLRVGGLCHAELVRPTPVNWLKGEFGSSDSLRAYKDYV